MKNTPSSNVLLTGGNGMLGWHVAKKLSEEGISFVAPKSEDVDLTDKDKVREFFGSYKFKTIIHFASAGVKRSAFDQNIIDHELSLVKSLWPLIHEEGSFIYAGSMSEYGKSGCLSESMTCTPKTSYGHAKLKTSDWLINNSFKSDIKVSVGRIFGAYGPREASKRLFPSVLNALTKNSAVSLSDGMQVRDFVHAFDVAEAFVNLAKIPNPPKIINIGTGKGLILREVLVRLCDELNAKRELLEFGCKARSPHDLQVLIANTSLFYKTFGYIPPQRLDDNCGIADLLYCKNNKSNF